MSKTIDERVVSMQFDNKNFEKNVQTSLSTLDKLKQKLKLKDASKGLENVNKAAKNVDMTHLGKGLETVTAKFSALEVMGVTALANITNSAVNAGKRIVSALTIDPIKTGFQEYETKMGSIQTIMSNTASKGTTMADVTRVIDELNTYADKTIYNFAEMTRNIGTFTAAGVGLEESAAAIKGIANLAAASGSNSQQASTAMYQLSQALASGTVKLMDWNSVVNAGMGGEKFQEALKATAREHGIAIDSIIEKNGSFRESLQEGWISADILNETLNKFTVDGATNYAKSMMESGKWTKEQADALIKEAQAMEDAATKVKTFTQLWDTLKEAAQSGWGKTWELIIGDFEKAKERLTSLSDLFGGIIDRSSDRRNNFLESVLSSKWDVLSRQLNAAGIETDIFQEKVKELAKSHNVDLDSMIEKEGSFEKALRSAFKNGTLDKSILSEAIKSLIGDFKGATESTEAMASQMEKYGEIVDKVINGDFGNGEERIRRLTEAGYDYATVQNLVNEKLGSSVRHLSSLSEEEIKNADNLAKLSEEQLKNKGYTEEQIEALKFLSGEADKAGKSIDDLISEFEKPSGAELLWESLMNIIHSIVEPIQAVSKAWREIFSIDGDQLYNALEGFRNITSAIREVVANKDNLDKLTRSFKGLFAIIDIITTVVGGGFKLVFKALSKILEAFDMNILDLTANIGDAIVVFRDFLFNNGLINKGFELLASGIKKVVEALKSLFDAFMNLPSIQNFINNIKNIDLIEIGRNIIDGLKNGLSEGISSVPGILIEIGKNILSAIKGVLGIHSPSTEMHKVGTNAIEGLINGVKEGASKVFNAFKNIGSICIKALKNIDWNSIFAGGVSIALLLMVKKLTGILETIISPFEGLGSLFSGVGEILEKSSKSIKKILNNTAKVVKSFSKVLNAKAFKIRAEGIKDLAISLAILAGSVYILAQLDTGKLWNAVGAITVLSAVMVALAWAIGKMSEASASIGKDGIKIKGVKSCLISIGIALLLIATTVKMIGSLNPEQAKQGFIGLAGLVASIGVVILAFGKLVNGKQAQNIDKLGKMLTKLSIALLILVAVVKLVGLLSVEEMAKGAAFAVAFLGFVTALSLISKLGNANRMDSIGKMLTKISLAMLLMVGVVKLAGQLSAEDMNNGAAFAGAFLLFVAALVLITKIGKEEQIAKIGGLVMSISVAMLLLVGVVKLVGKLSAEDMIKGTVFAGAFLLFVAALVSITKIGNEQRMAKVAGTILAMSVAIGIMAGVCILLGLINLDALAKGVIAVGILGSIMALMIKTTNGAQDCKGNIIAMTVAIGIMAAAVVALSFIDGSKLAGATAALSIVMGMFALIAKASGSIQSSIAPLIVMTVAIGLMAGAIYLLAGLDIESALASSASLSLLMASMSVSLLILSKIGSSIGNALLGVAGLLAMSIPLLAFVGILALMQNVKNATTNVTALTVLATALTLLLVPLSLVGILISATGGLAALGIVALLAMAIPLLSLVGILALMQNIQNATSNTEILVTLMNAMTNMLMKVSILAPLALMGVTAISALVAVITAIGGVVVAIGALMTHFPQIEEFVNAGIPILEKLANGIGSIIGSFINGFATEVLSGLPEIGLLLSQFMINAMPFISGVKLIDSDSMEGIKALVETILILTGANIIEGLTSWLTGGSSIAEFGKQIAEFGPYIKQFSDSVSGINSESVASAANAGKMLAEMADAIPNSGGVAGFFAGNNDMSTFGSQLKGFGEAIADFSSAVDGKVNESAVTSAANAGKMLSELADSLPNSGGVAGFFAGDNDMSTFGSQLKGFGKAIADFSLAVDGKVNESAVASAANAGKLLAKLADSLPNSGGVAGFFAGNNDMSTFGAQLKEFGKAIAEFSMSVSGKIGGLDSAIASINKLMYTLKNIASINASAINSFKKALSDLGKTGIDSFIKGFNGSSAKAKNAVSNFIKSISSTVSNTKSYLYSSFYNLGAYLVRGFANGISANTYMADARAAAMARSAYNSAKKELDVNSPSKKFMEVGGSVVEGFAKGIDDNVGDAEKSAVSMGKSVLNATKSYLKINSPSIVFNKEVGRYIVQGIAEGITEDMSAEEAAEKKAQNIKNAFKKELDRISTDSDIAKNKYDLWLLTEGKYASDSKKDSKELEYLNGEVQRNLREYSRLHDQWYAMKETFGENSDEAKSAFNEMLSAQVKIAETNEKISEISINAKERENQSLEREESIRSKNYKLWEKIYGDSVSAAKKEAAKLKHLNEELKYKNEDLAGAQKDYNEAVRKYGENSTEAREAFELILDEEIKIADLKNEINDVHERTLEREKEDLEREGSIREQLYELWLKTDGVKATDVAKDAKQLKRLNEELNYQLNTINEAEKDYNEAVRKYGENSSEAREAYSLLLNEMITEADIKNEINDIYENALKREEEALEKQYQLASSNADLKYQIWEKVYGRDASDAEKDATKLSSLNEQLMAQSELLKLSQKAYEEAVDTYGTNSVEALSAYNEYLQEEKTLAELHSDILDVKESIEDRERRLQERQRNAKSEYLKYMEKYEKYYLDHGMTLAELEKDAMLVSEYDPSKTISNTISETSDALNDATKGYKYSELLSNFSNVGTSYATSINDGILSETPTIINGTSTMISECVESIKSTQPLWFDAGIYLVDGFAEGVQSNSKKFVDAVLSIISKSMNGISSTRSSWYGAGVYLVNGFVDGIKSQIQSAANAAAEMAYAALRAAEEAFDINSPSKEFARIGRYAVMGLAEGLSNNSKLASEAASNIGDKTIDNLKNSIKYIYDVINSDIDIQPTIRPVLDLSNVTSGATKLNAMLSRTQALRISGDMSRKYGEEIQNGMNVPNSGNTYQFTQNNYSPKALSRVEIYRQTKNQFSMMKRMVDA